jgi:hypothetical protein
MLKRLLRRKPALTLFNHPYATATTPDQMIEAAIIQSIAAEFPKWSSQGVEVVSPTEMIWENDVRVNVNSRPYKLKLLNTSKNITCEVELGWDYKHRSPAVGKPKIWGWQPTLKKFVVNDIPISDQSAEKILTSYIKVRDHLKKVEAEAAAALERQKLEEEKWNLAENLLGLCRDEKGALVPKVTAHS